MARRQSNGDGTRARQLADGRWRIDMTIGDDGDNKSRKSLYGKSEAEVIAKRDNLKDELKNGCLVTSQSDKLTLGMWLDRWLETYKKGKVSDNTYSVYSDAIKTRISNSLKETQLKKLRNDSLQKALNDLNTKGKKYSSSTCRLVRVVLQQSLKVAVKNRYIMNNPADGLEVTTLKKSNIIPLTKEELQKLLDNRKGTRYYLYYLLSVYSGARIGEILGLRWEDIDIKKNILHIRHCLKLNKETKEQSLGPTKNGKPREIPMSLRLHEAIKQHKAQQAKEKLKFGKGFNVDNMVFCDEEGKFCKDTTIRPEVARIIKKIGVTMKCSPHTLRHTFVSQMISAGVNIKIISEMVGHASINITLDRYGHLIPGDTAKAMQALETQMQDIVI